MGFWDRIIKGRLFAGGRKEEKSANPARFSPAQTEPEDNAPEIVVELEMDRHKCMLESFDLNFGQYPGVDDDVWTIALATSEALFPELGRWVTLDSLRKDGYIRFYANETSLTQGALFEIGFFGAQCKKYERGTGDTESGMMTRLEIMPQTIHIGREIIRNFH